MKGSIIDYEAFADFILGVYGDHRIDWDDALYRVEVYFNVDLPEQMTDPVILAIKKETARLRKLG